jgi:surface protein
VPNPLRAFHHRLCRAARRLLAPARSHAGAFDLPSIITGVVVVGILTAGVLAAIFGVVPWAQDNGARQDLDSITRGEGVAKVKDSRFMDTSGLDKAGYVAAKPGWLAATDANGSCYVALAKSDTGKLFVATSKAASAVEFTGAADTSCLSSGVLDDLVKGLTPGSGSGSAPSYDVSAARMISTWDTSITPAWGDPCTRITLPLNGTLNATVNWGDGSAPEAVTTEFPVHDYAGDPGPKTITIDGTFTSWVGEGWPNWSSECITAVPQWGETGTTDVVAGFWNATHLTSVDRIPLTATNYDSLFENADIFNGDISGWDTSKVTNMAYMFDYAYAFNQDISGWDTSNVTSMYAMFRANEAFNYDLSSWDTHAVTDMRSMFSGSTAFDRDISGWDVANVVNYKDFNKSSALVAEHIPPAFRVAPAPAGGIMTSVWDTSLPGCTAITVPADGVYSDTTVSWGDGSASEPLGRYVSHTYSDTPGPHTVTVQGQFTRWVGTYPSAWTPTCLTGITAWGPTTTTDLGSAFKDTTNLTSIAAIPAGVTNLSEAFYQSSFNGDISNWDTSRVTTMANMFALSSFNQPIGNWNTANVTDTRSMFYNAEAFNQPLGSWNTSSVTNMAQMFLGATSFNQPIGSWDTSRVTNIEGMFTSADSFNQDISGWDTSQVTNMHMAFMNASAFNGDISGWNTSSATSMESMFSGATSFNSAIGGWNTSNVTTMFGMLQGANSFNQPIGGWNTAKVTTMAWMFQNNQVFNQDISGWDTSRVTDMAYMFYSDNAFWPESYPATAFNQDISRWNTSSVTDMTWMFYGAGSFNQNLSGWNVSSVLSATEFAVSSKLQAGYLPTFP